MDNINFLKYDQFPISSETLDMIEQMITFVAKLANFGGTSFILSGCEDVGTSCNSGIVVINGELLPFQGGVKSDYVVIAETDSSVVAYNQSYDNIISTRKVIFGMGTGQLLWSSFTRIKSLLEIDSELQTHISDTVKHITDAERTAWDTLETSKADVNHNHDGRYLQTGNQTESITPTQISTENYSGNPSGSVIISSSGLFGEWSFKMIANCSVIGFRFAGNLNISPVYIPCLINLKAGYMSVSCSGGFINVAASFSDSSQFIGNTQYELDFNFPIV